VAAPEALEWPASPPIAMPDPRSDVVLRSSTACGLIPLDVLIWE
jgi:hypothetical protein